ncbi:hypothetical protein TNCV_4521401 [Trichonephila clavipes]|nr:hypothetical protein TNCV_4521401 [Trichonephila clavipes]
MPVVSLSFKHHSGDSTILLGSTPILRDKNLGVVRGFANLFPFHKLLERTYGSTAIYSIPMPGRHLQTSMPSPGFELRLYGTAVSATNHYTGWDGPNHYT